jgi:hypothetical protein
MGLKRVKGRPHFLLCTVMWQLRLEILHYSLASDDLLRLESLLRALPRVDSCVHVLCGKLHHLANNHVKPRNSAALLLKYLRYVVKISSS